MPVASCQKCQEFLVPDDDSVIPVHYHPYARFDDANNRSSSERNFIFLSISGLKIIILKTNQLDIMPNLPKDWTLLTAQQAD